MKIHDRQKFKNDVAGMLKYKWDCVKEWMRDSITEDIVKFVESYKNERNENESR